MGGLGEHIKFVKLLMHVKYKLNNSYHSFNGLSQLRHTDSTATGRMKAPIHSTSGMLTLKKILIAN